jgi:hypothetical protein
LDILPFDNESSPRDRFAIVYLLGSSRLMYDFAKLDK